MRRKKAQKQVIIPDVIYNSEIMAKMINIIMKEGKKSVAEKILYGAMDIIKKKLKDEDPLEVFFQALDNVKPQLQVKSRRVGGATYQVPVEVPQARQATLAMRWIIQYAKSRKGKPMKQALAEELMDAFKNTGSSVKKKEDTHKMAAANKAFAHYRW